MGLVITKDGSSVIVETNELSTIIGTPKVSFDEKSIGLIYIKSNGNSIDINMKEWRYLTVGITQTQNVIKIDSVLGVDCTTIEILFTQLTKLRG